MLPLIICPENVISDGDKVLQNNANPKIPGTFTIHCGFVSVFGSLTILQDGPFCFQQTYNTPHPLFCAYMKYIFSCTYILALFKKTKFLLVLQQTNQIIQAQCILLSK